MKTGTIRVFLALGAFLMAAALAAVASAQTETVRIVTYNIEADIQNGTDASSVTTPRNGLISPVNSSGTSTGTTSQGGVLEGIGEEPLGANNNVQPLDILALEETTSNVTTVAPIVAGLNAYYGTAGMYAQSSLQGSQSGSTGFGNGPNAIVYNTHTLQLVASTGVGVPHGSSNGEYRQVMRYEFAPAGTTPSSANEFYVYVSHYKSGSTVSDQGSREGEATIIRNDSATLPSTSRILYVGDYNVGSSSEDSYQTIVGAGANQGIDPLNTSGATGVDWTQNSLLSEKTETATSLHYRDDFLMMTSNIFSDTAGGLQLLPNTYHTFGNNGNTPYNGSTNNISNTALNNVVDDGGTFISPVSLRTDLTYASDHLPVVADFTIPVPEPSTLILAALGGACLAWRRFRIRRG